jgi:hypothetical protein
LKGVEAMGTAIDQISVSEILRRVKKYGKLPEQGFLAGGAVANTILSIVDGTEYPVNDLDVFYDSKKKIYEAVEILMPERPSNSGIMVDFSYGQKDIRVIAKDSYHVLRAYRKGFLNFVKIKMSCRDSQNQNLTILKGFDIDCCQAGIDLATEQLVYTEAFFDFFNTRQLQVTLPVAPFHTSIRIFKKLHELNAYCNVAEEMSLLTHIPKLFPQDQLYYPEYANCFGKRMYELYKKYSSSLDQYFTVVPYIKTTVKPIYDSFHSRVSEEIIPLSKEGELYTLLPKIEIEIDEALKDIRSTAEFMPIWTNLKRGRKATVLKFKKASHYFFTSLCSKANPEYVYCDFHEKHLNKIEKFFSVHPYMLTVLHSLTIQQQLQAFRLIEKMAEKHGRHIIGLIENGFKDIRADEITEERILNLIDAYKQEYKDLSIAPLDISEFKFNPFIKELLTLEDLLEEGKRMHHCVGGYAKALKERDIRIFHIERGEESSTLEMMQYSTLLFFSVLQHRGPWNKDVGIEHKEIAEAFVQFLNQEYSSQITLKGTEQMQGELFAEVF